MRTRSKRAPLHLQLRLGGGAWASINAKIVAKISQSAPGSSTASAAVTGSCKAEYVNRPSSTVMATPSCFRASLSNIAKSVNAIALLGPAVSSAIAIAAAAKAKKTSAPPRVPAAVASRYFSRSLWAADFNRLDQLWSRKSSAVSRATSSIPSLRRFVVAPS